MIDNTNYYEKLEVFYCEKCEERTDEYDLYEHGSRLYCCGCLERVQESGLGNDLNDLIYSSTEG